MNPKYILVHCTDLSYRVLKNQFNHVNNYHKSLDFPISQLGYYVGYHSLITDGRLYKSRLDLEEGAHCNNVVDGQSMNFQSLGVCLAIDGDIEMPTVEDTGLLIKQIKEWQGKYNIPNDRVMFHRDFNKAKTCPGQLLSKEWLNSLLNPIPKPEDQNEKQKDILKQKISILEQLIALWTKLRFG